MIEHLEWAELLLEAKDFEDFQQRVKDWLLRSLEGTHFQMTVNGLDDQHHRDELAARIEKLRSL